MPVSWPWPRSQQYQKESKLIISVLCKLWPHQLKHCYFHAFSVIEKKLKSLNVNGSFFVCLFLFLSNQYDTSNFLNESVSDTVEVWTSHVNAKPLTQDEVDLCWWNAWGWWRSDKCNDINELCMPVARVADKAAVTRDAAAELERLRGKKVPEANSNDTGASGSWDVTSSSCCVGCRWATGYQSTLIRSCASLLLIVSCLSSSLSRPSFCTIIIAG